MNQQQVPVVTPPKPIVAKWLWITLIIVAILGGFFVAWYLLLGPGKPVEVVTTTTTPVAIDVTADWKAYANDQYGYSFKYPKDWIIDTTKSTNISLNSPANQKIREDVKTNGEGYTEDISFRYYTTITDVGGGDSNTWKTVEDWLSNRIAFTEGATKITLAGQTAYEGIEGGMSAYYHIIIPKDNHFYEIFFGTIDSKDKLNSIEKNILSTFKFTTATAATDSSLAKSLCETDNPGMTCTITKIEGDYAAASIGNEIGDAAKYLAKKVNGTWTMVINGLQDDPPCSKTSDFPKTIVPTCLK